MQEKSPEKSKDTEENSAPDGAPAKAAPALSPAKLAERQRLAEALRANLRRRKAQVRQRRLDAQEEPESEASGFQET